MSRVQKLSKTVVKKKILAFLKATSATVDKRPGQHGCGLKHKTSLVLATSYKDKPRATPLEFFHEDLSIYIFGEPGGKIANLKRNPKVSAAIYQQPLDHSKVQQSLQLFGKAELITVRNNPRAFKIKAKKWNLYGVAAKLLQPQIKAKHLSKQETLLFIEKFMGALNLIKIIPDHIILREYHSDLSMPIYEWKK